MQTRTGMRALPSIFLLYSAAWAETAPDLSQLNGYTIGRALSGYYDGTEKEHFVRGLLEGLKAEEDATVLAVGPAKSAWFDAPERTRKERASYAAGYLNGETYGSPELPYSVYAYIQGLADNLQSSGAPVIDLQQASQILADYQRAEFYKLKRRVADRMQANNRAGKAFLEANARNSDVVELPSGLQYRIIEAGQGDQPTIADAVVATLVGKKIDGEVFYDSRTGGDGKPVTVKVGQTLKGWQEALVKMSPGATWEVFIPAALAYGNAGWQDRVEPGEALIYEIKLIEIVSDSN